MHAAAPRQITVLVVDDNDLAAATTISLLAPDREITVVGRARDGLEALALADRFQPAVVLMDLEMPRLDGVAATRALLRGAAPVPTRVVMLTTFHTDEYVTEALRAGASGFLLKEATADQFVDAVRVVAEGEAMLVHVIMPKAEEVAAPAEGAVAAAATTPAEPEVIKKGKKEEAEEEKEDKKK